MHDWLDEWLGKRSNMMLSERLSVQLDIILGEWFISYVRIRGWVRGRMRALLYTAYCTGQ